MIGCLTDTTTCVVAKPLVRITATERDRERIYRKLVAFFFLF